MVALIILIILENKLHKIFIMGNASLSIKDAGVTGSGLVSHLA